MVKDSVNAAHQLNSIVKKVDFVIVLHATKNIEDLAEWKNIDFKEACDLTKDTMLDIQTIKKKFNMEFTIILQC